jgi:hypothetical protein
MFEDTTIDIQTGALLGRYIAEERDSGRRLRACHQALKRADAGSVAGDIADLRERVAKFSAGLSAVAGDIAKLRD